MSCERQKLLQIFLMSCLSAERRKHYKVNVLKLLKWCLEWYSTLLLLLIKIMFLQVSITSCNIVCLCCIMFAFLDIGTSTDRKGRPGEGTSNQTKEADDKQMKARPNEGTSEHSKVTACILGLRAKSKEPAPKRGSKCCSLHSKKRKYMQDYWSLLCVVLFLSSMLF